MEFSSDVLTLEKSGHIATLWLDRPEKRNAMAATIIADLPRAIETVANEEGVRALIIAGRGKSFTVGLDISGLQSGENTMELSGAAANLAQWQVTRNFQLAISAVAECPVPVIAAVHSHCIGAGVDLITACDIRLASKCSIFSIRETKIGIVADVGTLQRLPAIVGAGQVAELAYTGKDIDAAKAEKIGLVNDVFDGADACYQGAIAIAEEIAANPPLAVKGTKFVLQQSEDLTTDQSLLINGLWTMATTLNSNDLNEAMMAMMEKRPPKFTGS